MKFENPKIFELHRTNLPAAAFFGGKEEEWRRKTGFSNPFCAFKLPLKKRKKTY